MVLRTRRSFTTALLLFGAAASASGAPLTVTLGGDMIGPYRLTDDPPPPEVQAVADLFRNADLGFANQEGSIFDLVPASHAAAENGGGYPIAPARVAGWIRQFGIAIVSKANNHATDFGTDGLRMTRAALDAAGVASAGAGRDRAAACAPTYVERPGGTIALVSAATTFPPMAAALEPVQTRAGVLPRPGICAIRTRFVELVTPARLAALRAAASSAAIAVPSEPDALRIGDQIFRSARTPGHRVEMDPGDAQAVLTAIRAAHARGALVMLAVHAHETAGTNDPIPPADFEPLLLHRANEAPAADDPLPATFQPELFHQAVAAGADIVVRTGPHSAGGVEIYQGKPIFWGMGSLVFAFGGSRSYVAPAGQRFDLPAAWFRSIVATVRFDRKRLTRLEVRAVALASSSGPRDGQPHLLAGVEADEALRDFQARSATLGTTITITAGTAQLKVQDLSR